MEAPSDLALEASADKAIGGGGGAGPEQQQPVAADSYADYVPAKLNYGPAHVEHVVEGLGLGLGLGLGVGLAGRRPRSPG